MFVLEHSRHEWIRNKVKEVVVKETYIDVVGVDVVRVVVCQQGVQFDSMAII